MPIKFIWIATLFSLLSASKAYCCTCFWRQWGNGVFIQPQSLFIFSSVELLTPPFVSSSFNSSLFAWYIVCSFASHPYVVDLYSHMPVSIDLICLIHHSSCSTSHSGYGIYHSGGHICQDKSAYPGIRKTSTAATVKVWHILIIFLSRSRTPSADGQFHQSAHRL